MAQRLKGQNVKVQIMSNGVHMDTITAIRSFEVTSQLEIKTEGYLGETTNRKDSIFNGIQGRMEIHLESRDVFTLFAEVIKKAQQRVPGARIIINGELTFPNGDIVSMSIPEPEFGDLPVNIGSRGDYATTSLTFEAPSMRIYAR